MEAMEYLLGVMKSAEGNKKTEAQLADAALIREALQAIIDTHSFGYRDPAKALDALREPILEARELLSRIDARNGMRAEKRGSSGWAHFQHPETGRAVKAYHNARFQTVRVFDGTSWELLLLVPDVLNRAEATQALQEQLGISADQIEWLDD